MEDNSRIDELVRLLDSGFAKGVGHVNVDRDDSQASDRQVQTMGCSDCSRTPLACSVPTLQEGLDDYQ